MEKIIGVTNLLTGITVGIFAPLLALIMFVLIIPIAALQGMLTGIIELVKEYPRGVMDIARFGFKVGGNGLKRLRK